jgi:hypothetical protein
MTKAIVLALTVVVLGVGCNPRRAQTRQKTRVEQRTEDRMENRRGD